MDGIKFLLDTNAIIALQAADERLESLLTTSNDIFVPVIAVGELYFGTYKSARSEQNRLAVASFMLGRKVLMVDVITSEFYGQLKYGLRVKGRPIPENDIWIAALAIQHQLTLITNDAHFEQISELTWRSW